MAIKSEKNVQFEVKVPKSMTDLERLALSREIIDYIVERTKSGKDASGGRFPVYTSEYIKSLNFKNAGKEEGSIDLTLSGDMLTAMRLVESKTGKLVIGYTKDDEVAGRVEGNVLGTYGKKKPIEGKARDFLGFEGRTEVEELRRIVERYEGGNIKRAEKIVASIEDAEDVAEEVGLTLGKV
jgi:hypothetical protein